MAFIKKDGNFMGLPMNIVRGNPIPLDASEIWYSYKDMLDYACNNPTAYVGQILCLVDELNNTSSAYIILNVDGELQEIGNSNNSSININCDNKTIENIDNIIALKNWGIQYYKYIPETEDTLSHYELQQVDEEHPWIAGLEPKVAEENGQMVLAWYEPNLSNIEDVDKEIAVLQTSIKDIKNTVYTKTEIDKKIANASHLKRIIINSIEDIDINAKDADQYIYMILSSSEKTYNKYDEYMVIIFKEDDIENRIIEQVGSWQVDLSNYVTLPTFQEYLDKKIDVQPGYSLVDDNEIIKLFNIEDGAQKNYISSVNENNFSVDNGKLNLGQILISNISNLQSVLDSKIDKEDGKGLSSNDFTNEHLQSLQNTIQGYQLLNSKVVAIENILYDTVTEEGTIPGLVNSVNTQQQQFITLSNQVLENSSDIQQILEKLKTNTGNNPSIDDMFNFVTVELFEETVGEIDSLQAASKTLNDQVQEIKQSIVWSEL